MPPKRRVVTSLITALLVAAMPILASIYLAWMESYTTEKTLSLTYAQDVLRRIEATSSQFEKAQQMAAQAKVTPCSPDDMRLLRTIDFGASYIKAAGRVEHDTLLCTSQGVMNPAALGKPDLTTAQGVTEYLNKQLSPPPARPLNVFASNGFAVIVDPNLAVDVSTEGPDVELAVLVPSAADSAPIAVIGQNLPANWLLTCSPRAAIPHSSMRDTWSRTYSRQNGTSRWWQRRRNVTSTTTCGTSRLLRSRRSAVRRASFLHGQSGHAHAFILPRHAAPRHQGKEFLHRVSAGG